MSDTRYDRTNTGGGSQDRRERKDDGWQSRQGGRQSRDPGRKGRPEATQTPGKERETLPHPGTNTQGELAGISEASRETREELDARERPSSDESGTAAGTDQPPRMGGPLGPDRKHPHLPEGAQNPDTQGTGAGGFDRGVNATHVGAVHQGAREEAR